MTKHDWKLADVRWTGPETVFVWKCPGCGSHHEVFAPPSVGDHASASYRPPREHENCEDVMVKLIMES